MKMKKILIYMVPFVVITSCGGGVSDKSNVTESLSVSVQNNHVLSAAEQSKLTPDQVIENLKQGNKEFANNQLTVKNNTERVKNAASGQYPEAVILSCLDSRVPVEDVFHRGIGDVFVARVAGNIVNADILGSIEYGCLSGSKLVVVLGHGHCGAIKSAIDEVEVGNITELLSKIKPAVAQSKATFTGGEAKSSNKAFVDAVCLTNVDLMVKQIRIDSPILKEMEEKGQIKIVGAIYNMESGMVAFHENM